MTKFALPLLMILVSGNSAHAQFSKIDVLNANIAQCFHQTTLGETANKRACNKVIKSDFVSRDNKAIAFHNRAVINLNQGDSESAARDFQRAIRFKPEIKNIQDVALFLKSQPNSTAG